jgi:secondary thiamine-phosphate synthase enzyme
MNNMLDRLVPESETLYTHLDEGLDDMPAHIKSSMLGVSVTLPITEGRFNLGTWQGVWLCEHRDRASGRSIVITIQGERF